MNMHNPAHPGEILMGWITDLTLSITDFAAHLNVSRTMLSKILHGHSSVSADMDIKLSQALGTSHGFWLRMQSQRDLWEAQMRAKKAKAIRLIRPATHTA